MVDTNYLKHIISYLVQEITTQIAYHLGQFVGYAADKYNFVKRLLNEFIEGVKQYVECAVPTHLLNL